MEWSCFPRRLGSSVLEVVTPNVEQEITNTYPHRVWTMESVGRECARVRVGHQDKLTVRFPMRLDPGATQMGFEVLRFPIGTLRANSF